MLFRSDSPWGKGAPGWHLECSVMSEALLGLPFDIHTGGIDHREIHHPNEIAQNQAHSGCDHSGARIWMHNNFLIDRGGKMSKSTGDFLRLQVLIDKGIHPLAFRLMCLQAHYRSELEFSWGNLAAAFTRLKRMSLAVDRILSEDEVWYKHHGTALEAAAEEATEPTLRPLLHRFEAALFDDLNTASALVAFEETLASKNVHPSSRIIVALRMEEALGLDVLQLSRSDLRTRPKAASLDSVKIEAALAARKEARASKDFATSDLIRDDLIAKGVEVMDGDPLGWDWKIDV